MLVSRQRVLDQIRRSAAPICALIAPAGFGKSRIAQRIARLESHWAQIDCAPNANQPDISAQVADALGIDGTQALDPEQCARHIAVAWNTRSEPLTLIIENCEQLEHNDAGRSLVGELLRACPSGCKIILGARYDPAGLLSDYAAPHTMTTLRRDDLAFDPAETKASKSRNRATRLR